MSRVSNLLMILSVFSCLLNVTTQNTLSRMIDNGFVLEAKSSLLNCIGKQLVCARYAYCYKYSCGQIFYA